MKIDFSRIANFRELEPWLDKSTQKGNFLKVLSDYAKKNAPVSKPVEVDTSNAISNTLLGAVEGYMGKSYDDVNCYELVVETLEKSGVKYRGKDGLSAYLSTMAKEKNLPVNSFMTGEGLVEAAGNKLFTKEILKTDNPDDQALHIVKELEGLLKKGDVLSFSMQTAGHTGFISKSGKDWTYINSGRMDNNIRDNTLKKAVGEEPLELEIANWLKRASKKNESLSITLGRFDASRLASFMKERQSVSLTV